MGALRARPPCYNLPSRPHEEGKLCELSSFLVSNSHKEQFFSSGKESLQQLSPYSPLLPKCKQQVGIHPNCRRALKFSTLKNFIKIFLFEQRLIKSSQVKNLYRGKKKKIFAAKSLSLPHSSPHHNQLEKVNKIETHRIEAESNFNRGANDCIAKSLITKVLSSCYERESGGKGT